MSDEPREIRNLITDASQFTQELNHWLNATPSGMIELIVDTDSFTIKVISNEERESWRNNDNCPCPHCVTRRSAIEQLKSTMTPEQASQADEIIKKLRQSVMALNEGNDLEIHEMRVRAMAEGMSISEHAKELSALDLPVQQKLLNKAEQIIATMDDKASQSQSRH